MFQFVTNIGRRLMRRTSVLAEAEAINGEEGAGRDNKRALGWVSSSAYPFIIFSNYFFQFVTNVCRRRIRRTSASTKADVINMGRGGWWRQQTDVRVSLIARPYPFYFIFLSILFQFVTTQAGGGCEGRRYTNFRNSFCSRCQRPVVRGRRGLGQRLLWTRGRRGWSMCLQARGTVWLGWQHLQAKEGRRGMVAFAGKRKDRLGTMVFEDRWFHSQGR